MASVGAAGKGRSCGHLQQRNKA